MASMRGTLSEVREVLSAEAKNDKEFTPEQFKAYTKNFVQSHYGYTQMLNNCIVWQKNAATFRNVDAKISEIYQKILDLNIEVLERLLALHHNDLN